MMTPDHINHIEDENESIIESDNGKLCPMTAWTRELIAEVRELAAIRQQLLTSEANRKKLAYELKKLAEICRVSHSPSITEALNSGPVPTDN